MIGAAARDALLAALRAGRTHVEAASAGVRVAPGAADASLLLAFAQLEPALLDEVRRRALAPEDVPAGWRAAARAWRDLLDASGVDDHADTPAQRRLAPFLPPLRTQPWPLVTTHPLRLLHTSLGRATEPAHPAWAAATLELRDAVEGLARVAWAAVLFEVVELSMRVDSLARLPEPAQLAAKRVVGTLAGGFTLGTVPWLAGPSGALATLAPELRARGLAWTAGLMERRGWQGPLERFRDWRNSDLGHGLVGHEERLARLFPGEAPVRGGERAPFDELLAMLDALGPWLGDVQAALAQWPAEAVRVDAAAALVALGSELAWQGAGEPLWLVEGARRHRLLLRGVVAGERVEHAHRAAILDWAELAVTATATARGADAWLLGGATTVEQAAAAERDAGHAARRDVRPQALHARLKDALGRAQRVVVRGRAGTGKSRLLAQLAAGPERALPADGGPVVVLASRARPGTPLLASRVVEELNAGLRHTELALNLPKLGGEVLQADAAKAAAFWRELAALNPARRWLVVLDGLDEGGAAWSFDDDLAALLPPDDVPAIHTIVSYRGLDDLPSKLREPMRRFEAGAEVVDLDAFYGTAQGAEVLRRYLESSHPSLAGRTIARGEVPPHLREALPPRGDATSLFDVVVAAGERRFLWVYHYARGIEAGVLDGAHPAEWPEPPEFYRAYFRALEARANHHGGYVGTLRELLLTLAEAATPLDDATLLVLMAPAPREAGDPLPAEVDAPDGDTELIWAWLRPVLHDVGDFVERRYIDPRQPPGDLRDAALILEDDIEVGRPGSTWVRRIPHATLVDVLREGALDPAWAEARRRVRERIARRTAALVDGWLEREGERLGALGAPVRYALHAWATHGVRAGAPPAETEDRARRFFEFLPEARHVVHTGRLPVWRRAVGATIDALVRLDDSAAQTRAYGFGVAGQLALAARDVAAALDAHGRALQIERVLAGLPDPPTDDDLRKALLLGRADAVLSLAIAWGNFGRAALDARDVAAALDAHRRALQLSRAVVGLAEAPTDDDLCEALRLGRNGALSELANAWADLGHAAQEASDVAAAVDAHRRELQVNRAVAGLPAAPTDHDMREALRLGRADALRELAIAWSNLGNAVLHARDIAAALDAHRRALQLKHVLAGLPDPPTDDDLRKALLLGRADAMLSLGFTWSALGSAALAGRDVAAALDAHRRALQLNRLLAGLPDAPTDDDLRDALRLGRAKALGALAGTWSNLGNAALAGRDVAAALDAHRRALQLNRLLAGLPDAPTDDDLRDALRLGRAKALGALAGTWSNLGNAALAGRDVAAALDAHRRALQLNRLLAGLPDAPTDDDLRDALRFGRAKALGALAGTWSNLGNAALAGRDVAAALDAHRRALQLNRLLAGLPDAPTDDDLREALRLGRADALRSLAIAWANLGNAAQDARDVAAALDAHRRELQLKRVLAGLPDAPSDDDLREALRLGRADALRSLAIAWANLGNAAQDARDVAAALDAHRRELQLNRVLAGLPDAPTDDDLREALRLGRADALRDLAIAWGNLGNAARQARDVAAALDAHRRALQLNRVLAGLPYAPTDDDLREALRLGRADALRSLAIAWANLGNAARQARDVAAALDAHRRELQLKRVLAGLPDAPTDDDLREALRLGRADALRSLAIAWGNLGNASRQARDVAAALDAHRRELQLNRVLAGLPDAPSDDDLREALRLGRADALRDLAIAWSNLGSAARQARDVAAARDAHRRELQLKRALAGLPDAPSDDDLREALRLGRADDLRDLAIAWSNLGNAAQDARDVAAALDAHRRELQIERARAGISDRATNAELGRACRESPAEVDDAAMAWESLSAALGAAGEPAKAAEAKDEAARLRNALRAVAPNA